MNCDMARVLSLEIEINVVKETSFMAVLFGFKTERKWPHASVL